MKHPWAKKNVDLPHSKQEAKKNNLPRYLGKPCRYGHQIRYTSWGGCVQCDSIKQHRKLYKSERDLYKKRIEIDHKKEEAEQDYWGEYEI
jgi:hypothetical protein